MFDLLSFSENKREGVKQPLTSRSQNSEFRIQNSEFRSQEPGAGSRRYLRAENTRDYHLLPETWLNVRTEHRLEASLEFGRLREVTSENFRLVGLTSKLQAPLNRE
jgi:hypothetical protein